MGDAQSAQREDKKDAAAEEESGKVHDAQIEQNIEDKALKNNEQISEINGKEEGSIAEINGHCEDDIAAEAILSPEEDVPETEKLLKEEKTQLEDVELNEQELPNEDVALEMTEMDAKQNDINEGFKRFFSNIGLKLTVKRGSSEIATDVPDKEEANRPEDVEDTAKETKSENTEQNTDVNIAQEANDNDSTTCPTLTDATSEDVLENTEEKTAETKEEAESDNADAVTTLPIAEDAQQDASPEEEPNAASPSSPKEEVVVSPIKRFFTTGIFSGLRKKKKPAEDETTEKELVDMGKNEVMETTEQTEQQQDEEEAHPCAEGAAVEPEHKENELKDEILSAASAQTTDEGKSSSRDLSTTVTEPENLSSQDKVQASPLKRLLSGSSLKKHSKKQRGRKSSDAKLSDSGEHVSEQLLSSTESAENQKEEGHAQPPAEAAEEEGAWASFKKLVTPKKRKKRSSLTNEETQIPVVAEPKPSETEQISDHSTEEGKKRKDSSVSWEAVLCGSGRRRSRKTSDSEDETPQTDINDHKRDDGSKGAELSLESSHENENEILASSPKQAGSPSEGDGGSTWKSLKKLVTPKRKAKDEDESKDNIQSDSEVTQDESSFSIKKLLPGRKKRKSDEKQDLVSSDEADKDVASDDEDSETPAVVPLSEFDTVETVVHIQTQADIESDLPKEASFEHQQDLLDEMAEPVLPCDNLQTEANKVPDNSDAFEKQESTAAATNEEPDDLTESISKYQQLSDIPEEGIITETMATPASVAEEAAGDDTIAEDLIEITSEAFTAPEPVADITLTDETEMVSAVSQLTSESSKTSGNTTPVPAEYDVVETDTLLHQVVEVMSVSPVAVPVFSHELNSEKVVGSVSQQILETFVKEEPTILKIQRSSHAVDISTNVEELDAIHELAATSQTESISEVESLVSTEVVSLSSSEKYPTAELVVDEVQEVSFTHPEERFKELPSIEESHHLVEDLSDKSTAASPDKLPEGDEMIPDVGCVVEVHQAETQHPQIDSREAATEQEVKTVTEKEDRIKQNVVDQIQLEDKDQPVEVEELQELAEEQAATLDSESAVESLEKEIISKDPPETITYDLKEETVPLTETNIETQKEDETDAAQTENVQEPEASEVVQASTLDSKESSVQSPEEKVKTEDIPVCAEEENKELPVTTVKIEHDHAPDVLEAVQADEEGVPEAESVDKFKEEPEHLTEVNIEHADTFKTGDVHEPEVLQVAQTLTSEEGSDQSPEKEVIPEDVPEPESVDEPKKETTVPTKVKLEPIDASKTGQVQEPEVLDSEEKEVIPEDVPELQTVTDEPKEETILSTEVNLEPHVQEPEVVQVARTDTLASDMGSPLSLEKEATTEDITTAETDEPKQENELRAESEDKLPVEDVKTEPVQETEVTKTKTEKEALLNVHVVTEGPEGGSVDEFQSLTAVHVASVNEEASHVQVLEKAVSSEEISAPCADNAAVTGEPIHEAHLSAVQVTDEWEKEGGLPDTETKNAGVEHSPAAQVVTCNHNDAPVAILDVLIEETPATTEPLIDTVAIEQVLKEKVEAATPLMRDDVTETSADGSVVRMMHVPTLTSEDSHQIQVQVVDANIKSAGTNVDSVLEVGLTEVKEVLDVCHETIMKVDNLSATPKTEDELVSGEKNMTTQEVIQHVKEELPETVPVSEAAILQQDAIKHSDALTTSSAIVDHDQRKNLDETEVKEEKSEDRAEVIKSSSEELDVKKTCEQSQITQVPIVTPSKSGLVVPENTGIISSIGNVESPSNLSLEFKLNIQFGQAKAPASPPPIMEIITPMRQVDVSEVGVQAVEAEQPVKPTQSPESPKQTEVSGQVTETTKSVANLDSTERIMITTQPVQLSIGIPVMERVEPVQQIRSTDRLTSSIQATETTHPVRPTERREVFLSKPLISEACDQESKAEQPAKPTEEENDVWMDAEEGIYTQEETDMSFLEVEEPLEPQIEDPQEEKAAVEVEATPDSKTVEEEGGTKIHKTGGVCETESEEEDFAVALEDPDAATASVTTAKRD